MRIVVFSGFNQRAVIAFLRTLEKNNLDYSIIALSDDDLILSTPYKNKAACIRKQIALDINDIKNCIETVKRKTNSEKCFIAPSTEALNRFLLENRTELEQAGCVIPLVSKELYEQISDKEDFCELCAKNGISVPKEVTFSKQNIPFVLKPKRYETNGKILSPVLITDGKIFETADFERDIYCCQEFLSGKSYYLLYYFTKGGEIIKLAQENLLQQPNGKSVVAARLIDYKILPQTEKFEKLFKDINYQGLVMVEVRIKDENLYMIEANPRFWGPSQLFVDCGRNLFEYFLKDWGFNVNIKDEIKDTKYYWTGGMSENITEFESINKNIGDYLKSDIYNREDTQNIYKAELIKNLTEKYNDISKHSQYQILARNLREFIPSDKLNIKSRAEKERFDYIKDKISLKGKSILDIGANTGYFSFEALNEGAEKVVCFEGNSSHAGFIECASDMLNLRDKISVRNEYFDFVNNTEKYDICFLLNVLHHIGDDYGEPSLGIEKAKETILLQLNNMANFADELAFQLGFNWKGDRNKCLFSNGLKQELIDYIESGTKDFWEIKYIGIAENIGDKIIYKELNNENIKREDKLGEFLNRPIFIMESRSCKCKNV